MKGAGGWGGGGGMLVVSLFRGVNFGFWSHLGCSRQNAIIFSSKGLFEGCARRIIKYIYFFSSFCEFTRFMK